MMAKKVNDLEAEDEIREAFKVFDRVNDNTILLTRLRLHVTISRLVDLPFVSSWTRDKIITSNK